jgi:hypothetical protein
VVTYGQPATAVCRDSSTLNPKSRSKLTTSPALRTACVTELSVAPLTRKYAVTAPSTMATCRASDTLG